MVYRSRIDEDSLKEFAMSLGRFTDYPYVAFNPIFVGDNFVLSYSLSEKPMSWDGCRWVGEELVDDTINMDIANIKDFIDWSECHFNIACSIYEEKYCEGFNDGVDKGYQLGYEAGFDSGFDEGEEAAKLRFERIS